MICQQILFGVVLKRVTRPLATTFHAAFLTLCYIAGYANIAYSSATQELTQQTMRSIESDISSAQSKDLPLIEHRIARILQDNPASVDGHYLMSTLLLKIYISSPTDSAPLRQSAELATQAYELNHKSELGIVALANILDLTGEGAKGLDLFKEASHKGVKLGWRSHLSKARLGADSGDLNATLSEIELALKDSDSIRSLITPFLVAVISAKGESQDTLSDLLRWQTRFPDASLAHAVASQRIALADYKGALADYQAINKKFPDDKFATISAGVLMYRFLDQPAKGTVALRHALLMGLDPRERSITSFHLASALIKSGNMSDAEHFAIESVALSPDRDATVIAISKSYKSAGKFKDALNLLASINEQVPGLHVSYALRGELLTEKVHRPKDAVNEFTSAIVLDPTRSDYYNGRGLAYFGAGNLQFALQDFQSAVRVNPSDASARYNTACALSRLGRPDEAVEALASAVDLDDRLVNLAENDNDFLTLHNMPAFKAVIGGKIMEAKIAH